MVSTIRTIGLNQSLRGRKITLQAATLLGHGGELVAYSQVDGEMRLNAPVVLQKCGIAGIGEVPHQIAGKNGGAASPSAVIEGGVGNTGEKVGDRAKHESAAGIRRDVRRASIVENLAAKFESVLAPQIRDVIQDLQYSIRPDDFGPICTAQLSRYCCN